jgi:hypothetical protein
MIEETMRSLQSFGVRSLVTHVLMAMTLAAAVGTGLFVSGEIGRLSFVALLNFTAGVWICQSVHSVGNPEYDGILNVVNSRGE